MYPGSLPLIFNGSVPGHKKLFNVHRCSMYTGVQFDRFHCTSFNVFQTLIAYSYIIVNIHMVQSYFYKNMNHKKI